MHNKVYIGADGWGGGLTSNYYQSINIPGIPFVGWGAGGRGCICYFFKLRCTIAYTGEMGDEGVGAGVGDEGGSSWESLLGHRNSQSYK